jgi:hypothetical protein
MERGKPLQEGVRVKLLAGMTWERLAAMSPDEIREHDLYPKGFYPLPHPNHSEGGFVFPHFLIDAIKNRDGRDLTRFDIEENNRRDPGGYFFVSAWAKGVRQLSSPNNPVATKNPRQTASTRVPIAARDKSGAGSIGAATRQRISRKGSGDKKVGPPRPRERAARLDDGHRQCRCTRGKRVANRYQDDVIHRPGN